MSHAVVGAALITAFPKSAVPRRWLLVGATCAMLPDVDVVGFTFGILYGDMLGHRGLTHSIAAAALIATLALFCLMPRMPRSSRTFAWLYLFLATMSHGLLDAMTNGGLGVAFLSPFDNTRFFFAFRPISVSPIGTRFFSAHGMSVFASELQWLWLPSLLFAAIAFSIRQIASARALMPNQKT